MTTITCEASKTYKNIRLAAASPFGVGPHLTD